MRLPPLFRTTAFRMTLLFMALFAASAAAFLTYIYLATADEVSRQADGDVRREISSLQTVFAQGGVNHVNQAIIERAVGDRPFLYLLMHPDGSVISGNIAETPVLPATKREAKATFSVRQTDPDGGIVHRSAWGRQIALPSGELLFVGADIGESRVYVTRLLRAIEGASVLMIVLGLAGGIVISRNVNRSMAELNAVAARVEAGDLRARARVRGVGDEYDELAGRLNAMLDRLERLMGGLRHAGDAIAHDLRSPLTRLRARLEAGLIEVDKGETDPTRALEQALEDADGVLKTFNAVLAISRLQAAGAPDQNVFDPAELAADLADLYGPSCEEKEIDFKAEFARGLSMRGNREFLAQALSNLIDNAIKYTPEGGAIMLRVRPRSSGEVEFSVTDTGPGVPEADRARVVQRFVRLDNSRNQSGVGLGLSLVAAVAEAHGGRLELAEGPGSFEGSGPGLRAALVFPPAT
jgi:signal transduction histidine kinase